MAPRNKPRLDRCFMADVGLLQMADESFVTNRSDAIQKYRQSSTGTRGLFSPYPVLKRCGLICRAIRPEAMSQSWHQRYCDQPEVGHSITTLQKQVTVMCSPLVPRRLKAERQKKRFRAGGGPPSCGTRWPHCVSAQFLCIPTTQGLCPFLPWW